MFGGHTSTSLLPATLLGLATTAAAWNPFAVARADGPKDLGSVLAGNEKLSTYYNLIKTYPDILLQLPNYAGVTIVAPENDAFTKLNGWDPKNATMVTNILEYHMLQGTVATGAIPEGPSDFFSTLLTNPKYTNVTNGQNMIVNKQPGDVVIFTSGLGSRCTLVDPDITFSGGLIQVVDTLMVPPARLEPTARDAYKDLTAFLSALYATDLVDYFAETPNVTIFAPRNSAFQLVAGTLSAMSKEDLAAVMRYHLVPGGVLPSAGLQNGTSLTAGSTNTFAPTKLHIARAGNNLYVNRAQLVQPDILIANGVVHMIDGVLNPDAASATPDPTLGTQPPVFPLSGSTSTGPSAPIPFTTYLPCTSDCPVTTTSAAHATGGSTTSTGGARISTSKGAAAAGPRCTGMPAMAAGLGAGILGLGLAGIV